MKCIACDCFLTETELMMVKDDGEYEDMCYDCRGIAFSLELVESKEYHHQHLTDMVSDFFYKRSNKELEENS